MSRRCGTGTGQPDAPAAAARLRVGRTEPVGHIYVTGDTKCRTAQRTRWCDRNCATGDAIATIRELAAFNHGGTVISSTSGLPQATKTPGHGVWSHVSALTYAYSYKFFRFDAAGVLVGWTVIRQEAELDTLGDEYSAAGGAEVYNTAGTLIATGCSTTAATRFK